MARIYQGESGGDPTKLYGGGNFGFPNWSGRMGPAGISHAAGLAQDQPGTWHDAATGWMAANPGQPAPDFNKPADQDKVNRFLATKTYHEKTGRDLISDAQAGNVDYSALAGQWPSLAKGAPGFPDSSQANKIRESKYTQAADLDKAAQAAIKQIGEVGGDISKAMERIRAAQDKTEAAQEATLSAIGKAPKQPELDAVQHLGSLATVVGILGGLFTHAPMRASINGMASALEAYNSGDQRAYQQAYGNWKTQTDMLFQVAKMQSENVRQILYDEDMGINERKAMLDATLRASGLSQLADAARTQGEEVVLDWQEKMAAAQQSYDQRRATLEETQAWRQAQLAAKEQGKWEIGTATDPQGQSVQVRYNPDTGQFTDLTAQPLPYTPSNFALAAKPGAGGGGLEASKTLEVLDKDGNVVRTVLAREGKSAAGWVDSATSQPLKLNPGQTLREITPSAGGGGRAGAQVLRQEIGGREVLSDLQNAVSMPVGTTTGLFGTYVPGPSITDALHGDLVRTLTSQDAQLMQASMASMSRELSILMSPVYGGNWAAQQIDPLIPKSGDTLGTVIFKLARLAQSADNALEAVSKAPVLSGEQKAFASDLRKQIQDAIPWTSADALHFAQRGQGAKESFGDFVKKEDVAGKLPAGVPPGSTKAGTKDGNPVYKGPDGGLYMVH